MASFDITDKSGLQSKVRSETGYDDTPDELPASDLGDLVDDAMLLLAVKAGFTESDYFSDRGATLALLGASCIKSKASVENITVDSWSIGSGDVAIDASGAGDEDRVFAEYEDMMETGLAKSEAATESAFPTNINSGTYIRD